MRADRASPRRRRRRGRPSRLAAAQLPERILDVATELFLTEGFGATSIEAVAERARISKRTFYHRFKDKADLFRAVVHRLIARWLPPFDAALVESGTVDEILLRSARRILDIALSREALALHRLMLAEAPRFPELAMVISDSGARAGHDMLAALLERQRRAGRLALHDSRFAAEQFITMVLAVPQKRALGFGEGFGSEDLDRWARHTVALFLDGARAPDGRGSRGAGQGVMLQGDMNDL
jgi:AcrR family transcriptional regulator